MSHQPLRIWRTTNEITAMWLDSASQEAVERFWQQCGEVEPYPRSLERSLSLALPAVLVKLPHLKLQGVESWFAQRSATFQFNCRSRALLAGAQLGVYTKLIERDEAGAATQGAVYQIEDRADRVALALLAPPEDVLAEADTSAVNFTLRHESVSELLCTRFGLPASAG